MIASENAFETVEILNRVIVRDDFGAADSTEYTLYKKAAVKVTYRTGREKEIHEKLTALRVLKFKARLDRNIKETMVIRYYDEIYDIRSIDHDRKHRDTYMVAERGTE